MLVPSLQIDLRGRNWNNKTSVTPKIAIWSWCIKIPRLSEPIFFVKQYCLLSALNGMKYISEWSSYWKIIQNRAKRKLYKRNENHIGFLVVPIGFWKLDPYTIDVYLSPYVKKYSYVFFFLSFFSVSNKWIREGAQVFVRPCGLKRQTKYDFEWKPNT